MGIMLKVAYRDEIEGQLAAIDDVAATLVIFTESTYIQGDPTFRRATLGLIVRLETTASRLRQLLGVQASVSVNPC